MWKSKNPCHWNFDHHWWISWKSEKLATGNLLQPLTSGFQWLKNLETIKSYTIYFHWIQTSKNHDLPIWTRDNLQLINLHHMRRESNTKLLSFAVYVYINHNSQIRDQSTSMSHQNTFLSLLLIFKLCNFSWDTPFSPWQSPAKDLATWNKKESFLLKNCERNLAISKVINTQKTNILLFRNFLEVVLQHKAQFNPLSTNPAKWSNTLKQFVGFGRRIVWVCLANSWGWRLKG